MGISDELRDLAATPPEATAMSASLADQAVGFAIKARRVARMKIAAAATAGAIAAAGVGIGLTNLNSNSDLPATTPVVTITQSSSAPSQSSSASPSSPSPEQSPSTPEISQAPILVQPSQPEPEPTGPGTDPNILEEILQTLRSLPERILEALKPDSSSEPDPREADEDTSTPETSSAPTSSAPTSPDNSSSQASTPAGSASSPSESSQSSGSNTGGTTGQPSSPSSSTSDPVCRLTESWRGQDNNYYPQPGENTGDVVNCEQYREDLDKAKESSGPAESPSGEPVCTVIELQDGKEKARITVPCKPLPH